MPRVDGTVHAPNRPARHTGRIRADFTTSTGRKPVDPLPRLAYGNPTARESIERGFPCRERVAQLVEQLTFNQ